MEARQEYVHVPRSTRRERRWGEARRLAGYPAGIEERAARSARVTARPQHFDTRQLLGLARRTQAGVAIGTRAAQHVSTLSRISLTASPSLELKEVATRSSAAPPAAAAPAQAAAPPAASDVGPPISRTGLLTIRVVAAKNLSLPPGVQLPSGIQRALEIGAEDEQRGGRNRDSMMRKQLWWLP